MNLLKSGLPTREWCEAKDTIPFQCSVPDMLCFLQDLLDGDKSFSAIKVYLATISACHVGFGVAPIGQNPLIKTFMKGACQLQPMCKPTHISGDSQGCLLSYGNVLI